MSTLLDDLTAVGRDRQGAWWPDSRPADMAEIRERLAPMLDRELPIKSSEINDRIWAEGWSLFEADGSMRMSPQVQAFDCPDDFPGPPPDITDADAMVLVFRRAQEGSEPHRQALDVLLVENPLHWLEIAEEVDARSLPAVASPASDLGQRYFERMIAPAMLSEADQAAVRDLLVRPLPITHLPPGAEAATLLDALRAIFDLAVETTGRSDEEHAALVSLGLFLDRFPDLPGAGQLADEARATRTES